MLRILLASSWLVIPAGLPRADAQDDPNEPPLVGQPANFSGTVGSYKIMAVAQPTTLQAEDPLTLMVRITGHGPVGHPPTRPDLRHLAAITKRFAVEDLDQKADPAAGTWEFRYRLKPLNTDVTDIPALRFVYFKPGILPKEKGYQSAYSDSIPLIVKPRTEVQAEDVQGTEDVSRFDAIMAQLEFGRHNRMSKEKPLPFAFPGFLVIMAILLTPPLLCGGWYVLWRRIDPDAARQTRKRRSRAAQQALRALQRGPECDPEQLAAILATYLQARWELVATAPTPGEVADHFRRLGFPIAAVEQTTAFFRACDAARFAPGGRPSSDGLPAMATAMILGLEEQS